MNVRGPYYLRVLATVTMILMVILFCVKPNIGRFLSGCTAPTLSCIASTKSNALVAWFIGGILSVVMVIGSVVAAAWSKHRSLQWQVLSLISCLSLWVFEAFVLFHPTDVVIEALLAKSLQLFALFCFTRFVYKLHVDESLQYELLSIHLENLRTNRTLCRILLVCAALIVLLGVVFSLRQLTLQSPPLSMLSRAYAWLASAFALITFLYFKILKRQRIAFAFATFAQLVMFILVQITWIAVYLSSSRFLQSTQVVLTLLEWILIVLMLSEVTELEAFARTNPDLEKLIGTLPPNVPLA